MLEKDDKRRHARAGDIMVLVRRRKELATQIVAKLHAQGVPVAGVDRLRLGAPLAVKDLMAALRFAAQPLDDLSLANLLASPLIGWTQDDMLEYVPREPKTRLWNHLRAHDAPRRRGDTPTTARTARAAPITNRRRRCCMAAHRAVAGRAMAGRAVGAEANDPIDELVNAAFAYQRRHTPSLAGFIDWFDAGEGELKRDAGRVPRTGAGDDRARLQGIAGADRDPCRCDRRAGHRVSWLDWRTIRSARGEDARRVPLPAAVQGRTQAGRRRRGRQEGDEREMQEHWRLLYVAMTRAEEALFIGGSLGRRSEEGRAARG